MNGFMTTRRGVSSSCGQHSLRKLRIESLENRTLLSVSGAEAPILPHDLVGLCDNQASVFYLSDANESGTADITFQYGIGANAWIPMTGDWDGDGVDTPGFYDPVQSVFYLRNANDSGYANLTFSYGVGRAGWLPLSGDWRGNGFDGVGLYDPTSSTFYLKNDNNSGIADITFMYGPASCGWTPMAADWDGDGVDTIGLYNPAASMFYLRDENSEGVANNTFLYGPPGSGWLPIAGNWLGILNQTIGLYDRATSTFYLRDSNSTGVANTTFNYGPSGAGWLPLAGDWYGHDGLMVAAAGPGNAAADRSTLHEADLPAIVDAAVEQWTIAGLDASILAKFDRAEFVVADLPVACLGHAMGNQIFLDRDAAGHGWFLDPTPLSHEEFSTTTKSHERVAVRPDIADRIDLLSVVEHELGHLAGYDDLDALAQNVMRRSLETGVRLSLD